MRIIIEKDAPERTVKEYLKRELQLSTGLISQLKRKERGICLDGEPVTVRHLLKPPCVLELAVEDGEESKNPFLEPEDLPLDVVWEDEHLVALNKPPYMPTHPSLGHRSGTLANALAYHCRERESTFVFRPINRLDRDTSGIVLCAYDRIAAARYTKLLKEGCFEKIYLAVVVGEMHGSGTVELPIRRAEASIILRETCKPEADGAEYAKTEYQVLATDGAISVLRVKPITGRTHQIRVHLSALGHPILGDRLYGEASSVMPRQALHAVGLTVRDGERLRRFSAPVPEDIYTCIQSILPNLQSEELL